VFTKAVGTPDIWDLYSEEWGLKDNNRRRKRRKRRKGGSRTRVSNA